LTLASLEQNANGEFFGLDVIGPTGKTGIIDASSGTVIKIPEPSSLAMLGGSLLLAGVVLRRRKETNAD